MQVADCEVDTSDNEFASKVVNRLEPVRIKFNVDLSDSYLELRKMYISIVKVYLSVDPV